MKNDNIINIIKPLRNGAPDTDLERLFVKANENRIPFYKE